jgi:formamidopyrimidine-DNA glycosylase
MPELPEVESIRRLLEPAMRGARITHVLLRRKDLRRPFPPSFAARLQSRRVDAVERRGKYLLVKLDSGDTLLMHLGMSGWFRVDRPGRHREAVEADRHDHVVMTLSNGAIVTFNDPRRFGLMDLVGNGRADSHHAFEKLGPEPLSAALTAETLAAALRGKRVALKVALLDQRVIAGVGNIYASEALHLARLSPLRRSSSIVTATGRPRPAATRLTASIQDVLSEAIDRKETPYRGSRFRVYEKEGERCPRRACRGTIRRVIQAGRSTFYCPVCQR